MITNTTLILDAYKAKKNIQKMASKARKLKLELRPHFKTHQSHKIGSWFRDEGVEGITVSSIKMAEYFATDGWKSITIAFPVNILEVNRLDELASSIDLRLLATDIEVLDQLNMALSNEIGVYIEVDPNYQRSGIPISEFERLSEIKSFIEKTNCLRFEGFYAHTGHTYQCRSKEEIRNLTDPIIEDIANLKAHFNVPICFGDTPSCSVLDNFGVVDQLSPGNFVFYDWTQFNIQSCDYDEIALAMYCPVVAKYPERNELIIHGGAVHFSKDSFTDKSGKPYFGVIAENKESGWGDVVDGVFLKSISQEHGIVSCTSDYLEQVKIGDLIPVIPIHSCLTADVMGSYLSTSGEKIDHLCAKKIM